MGGTGMDKVGKDGAEVYVGLWPSDARWCKGVVWGYMT
jgi:hypothetical protein